MLGNAWWEKLGGFDEEVEVEVLLAGLGMSKSATSSTSLLNNL
jgi:hypothetical protein